MSGDIEDKPQPLIEHLMELRTRLMWSIGAFF
ncbi:twin-arginine translocase subunit TatC, partial [Rhizobium ruizarguesonis]